jgi:hypothetical protein
MRAGRSETGIAALVAFAYGWAKQNCFHFAGKALEGAFPHDG